MGAEDQTAAVERSRDAARTRAELLDVATEEFARQGYTGARVDDIAARTSTTKRMIYYYFGGKEGLYVAVLDRAYARIRALEQELDVEHLDPVAGLRRLAELTFDHHEKHPEFVRLVSIENIHNAEHLRRAANPEHRNAPAVAVLERILERGRASASFREDIDALDVHMIISAFCVFRVANRHTFDAIFGRDLLDARRRRHQRRMLADLVVDHLTARPEPRSD